MSRKTKRRREGENGATGQHTCQKCGNGCGFVVVVNERNTFSNRISSYSRKRKFNGFGFESVAFSLERLFSAKSRKANDNKYQTIEICIHGIRIYLDR